MHCVHLFSAINSTIDWRNNFLKFPSNYNLNILNYLCTMLQCTNPSPDPIINTGQLSGPDEFELHKDHVTKYNNPCCCFFGCFFSSWNITSPCFLTMTCMERRQKTTRKHKYIPFFLSLQRRKKSWVNKVKIISACTRVCGTLATDSHWASCLMIILNMRHTTNLSTATNLSLLRFFAILYLLREQAHNSSCVKIKNGAMFLLMHRSIN